ncbi:MAG: hypothetical protein K0S53_1289 [Bacteroidetes bacterium]|nr:hypothetical protein [Bacteroidota bacterium]MDF2453444.1 hypothetical protein [Bacteroidota bacterium]
MRIKFIVFLCPLFLITLFCNAQRSKDAGMWATFTIQHPLTKKINLVIDQEFRLKENYQRINLFYTNVGVDYKFNKSIKISPTYRTIQKKRLDGSYSYRHRLMLDVTLKKKLNKITLSERIRYQIEVQDLYTSRKGKLEEQFLRFKTDVKYSLSDRITPYFSCELRYQIRSPRGDGPAYNNGFHRIRNVFGFEYQLNKKNSVNLYYLVQSEFNISTPESIYILGIAYSLTI